jgi:hypothetical protein
VPSEGGGAPRSCPVGEAIMEVNEGVPAFVAWLTARQLNVVTDERLRMQFNVQQRDNFYVTAMMQLVVLQRLLGDRFTPMTEQIAASASAPAGSIFAMLETELARRCQ